MSLGISISEQGPVAVVAVSGELDMNTAPQLFDAGAGAVDSGCAHLVLDLGEVTFCDSAGLGVFVRLKKRLDAVDGRFVLARPTENVRMVLDVTGLTDVIGVHPSVEQAAEAARG